LEQGTGLSLGRLKEFEDGATKQQAATRTRLAQVLGAPDLERFGDEGDERPQPRLISLQVKAQISPYYCDRRKPIASLRSAQTLIP
jgi:hypothetical protein